jgi:hypothetical protein
MRGAASAWGLRAMVGKRQGVDLAVGGEVSGADLG